MADPDQATQSMIDNLPQKTGRSLEEWFGVLEGTDLSKHTELMNHLKRVHGVSHGFANGKRTFDPSAMRSSRRQPA